MKSVGDTEQLGKAGNSYFPSSFPKSMKIIYTKTRKEILVDDSDFEHLNQWRWSVNSRGYAVRSVQKNKIRSVVRMHRQLAGLDKNDQREVDHINRNKLDNQRANLRILTREEHNKYKYPYSFVDKRTGKEVIVNGMQA